MQIDKNSFHWRIYTWWYGNKYRHTEWLDGYHLQWAKAVPERSNLCPYMRAVMFWAPLRWYFCWGKIAKLAPVLWSLAGAVIAVPIVNHHHAAILKFYAIVVVATLLIVGVIVGFTYMEDRWPDPVGLATIRKIKSSSFWALLRAYLRAAHDRVCPEVEPKP